MKTEDRIAGRAIVLLSGGLDSAAAVALAGEAGCRPVGGLFVDYGQRAAPREHAAARGIADFFHIPLERIELPWMARLSKSALVAGPGAPPRWSAERLDDGAPRAVWVENRNAVLIDIAAFCAAEREWDAVVVGFNREEAVAFPDNSAEYVDRVNRALELSLRRRVRVVAPTIDLTKQEIVRRVLALDFPWELLWSCYGGGELPCGSCESCLRLKRAVGGTAAEHRVRLEKEDA